MPPRDAKIDHMLRELDTLGRNLTRWEENFLADVTDQWERSRSLSDRQHDILEKIYTERV